MFDVLSLLLIIDHLLSSLTCSLSGEPMPLQLPKTPEIPHPPPLSHSPVEFAPYDIYLSLSSLISHLSLYISS